jgi:hypothetical protein
MASKKVTITLPEDLLAQLLAAAQEEDAPVSRLVAAAVEHELRQRAGRKFIEDWQAEHGTFTPEEIAAARAELAAADAEYFTSHSRTVA